jgi:hypothetical protein
MLAGMGIWDTVYRRQYMRRVILKRQSLQAYEGSAPTDLRFFGLPGRCAGLRMTKAMKPVVKEISRHPSVSVARSLDCFICQAPMSPRNDGGQYNKNIESI